MTNLLYLYKASTIIGIGGIKKNMCSLYLRGYREEEIKELTTTTYSKMKTHTHTHPNMEIEFIKKEY